jgi:hypothetical protein
VSGLETLGWCILSAAGVWGVTIWWASWAFSRDRARMQELVDCWRARAHRERDAATYWRQVSRLTDEGRVKGREDVLASMPLLVATIERMSSLQALRGTGEDM